MNNARVLGHATATVRHPSLASWRLLVVQPLSATGAADGDPQLAIDDLGCGRGDLVILSSDGASVTERVGRNDTPIRWAVIGVVDDGGGSSGEQIPAESSET